MNLSDNANAGLMMTTLATKEPLLALTFDDGPDDNFTPRILDLLHDYDVPATFFCIGSVVEANPSVAKRIVDAGHLIANHTWTHPQPPNISVNDLISEVSRTSDAIKRATGQRPAYFRPPYGNITNEQIDAVREAGYHIVHWSADSIDWSGIPGPEVAANVLTQITNGSIILLHSAGNVSGTIDALPYIIEVCHQFGYQFRRLDTIPE